MVRKIKASSPVNAGREQLPREGNFCPFRQPQACLQALPRIGAQSASKETDEEVFKCRPPEAENVEWS